MRSHRLAGIALLLALCSTTTGAATDPFEANLAIAKKNIATEKGAAYDQSLGAAMQAKADVTSNMMDCIVEYSDSGPVYGYFQFTSATQYKVVLRPKGPLADCVTQALEGQTVPPPPSLPWLNPFELGV